MKKILIAVLLFIFCLSFVSCSTINIATDKGKFAFLMPEEGGVVKEVRTKMVFYVLWGLVPVTDNSTKDLIKSKEKVKVKTTTSFVDAIISCVGSFISVQSRTIEVDVMK